MVMITTVQWFSMSGAAVSLVDIAGVDCLERRKGGLWVSSIVGFDEG